MKKILLILLLCFTCIVKAETVDQTAPVLKSISPVTTTFKGGEIVEFEVDASDDISGINEILLTFLEVGAPTAEGNEYTFMIGLYPKEEFSNARPGLNDFKNGKHVYAGYVPYEVKEGNYNLFKVNIDDNNNNTNDYCMNNYYGDHYIINDFNFPVINTLKYEGDLTAPKLVDFKLSSKNVKVGEKVKVEVTVDKPENVYEINLFHGAEIYELKKGKDDVFRATMDFDEPGTYELGSLQIIDKYYKQIDYVYKSPKRYYEEGYTFEEGTYDVVVSDKNGNTESKLPELKDIKITKSKVKAPSILEIHIYSSQMNLRTNLVLKYKGETTVSENVIASDEGWDGDHYTYKLEVSQYAKSGTYEVQLLYLTTPSGKTVIYADKPEAYKDVAFINEARQIGDYSFEVVEDLQSDLTTSIDNLEIIDQITNVEDNSTISIDTTKSTIIPSKVFEAIKDTNKTIVLESNGIQWHFNGKDITNAKDIDIETKIYYLEEYNDEDEEEENATEEDIWENKKALVIDFADNKELPGKVLIKVKADFAFRNYLDSDDLTLYYRNGDMYDLISDNIMVSNDGFYEFYLNHNSVYYLTNQKLNKKVVKQDLSEELGNTKLNEEVKKLNTLAKEEEKTDVLEKEEEKPNYIPYIIGGVILLIVIVVVVIIVIKRKKNTPNEQNIVSNQQQGEQQ